MRNEYIVKKIYRSFVLVSVLSALTATLGALIDNVVVGRFLGTDALGAMSVISPITLIYSAVGNICAGGGTVRAAQAIGRGEKEQVRVIFTSAMLFVIVVGGMITAVGLLFTHEIAALLGAKGALAEPTIQFLRGYFLSAVPTIMMTALMGFIKVDGSPNLPLISIIVMTTVNITLDLVMVLVFEQGMFGVALATTISYIMAVLTGCLHFTKKYNTLKLVAPGRIVIQIWTMVSTGIPTATGRVCDMLKILILNHLMVAVVGVGAIAALNVRMQVNNLIGAIVVGFGNAETPIAGMFFGEEDKTSLRSTLKQTLKLGMIMTFLVAALLLVFPAFLPKLLGITGGEILSMSEMAVRFFAVSMPICFVNTALMNFFQSTRRIRLASIICVLQYFVYTVLTAFILISPMGSTGVWLAFLLGEGLTFLTIIVYVTCKIRRLPRSLEDIMMLPEDFGGEQEHRLELSIGNDMKEVMAISQGIGKFTQKRGIDDNLQRIISLCIEEMAGNVVKHAFKQGEKRWLDMILLDKEDSIVLSFRDNGAAFNPVAFLHQQTQRDKVGESGAFDTQEKETGWGIKMIAGLVTDFQYSRGMGLNTLTMTMTKQKN